MATFTPKRLAGPALMSNSVTSVYSVPTGRTAVVKQIIFNNTSSTNTTVTVHVVANAGTPAASNQVVSLLSIAGYSQIIWAADVPLAAGESIQLVAGSANIVTATVSGIEIA